VTEAREWTCPGSLYDDERTRSQNTQLLDHQSDTTTITTMPAAHYEASKTQQCAVFFLQDTSFLLLATLINSQKQRNFSKAQTTEHSLLGKTGLIPCNFTNSQYLLIILGRERPYSILGWLQQKVFRLLRGFHSDPTHLKQQRSGLTSNNVIINRATNEWQNNCGPVWRLTDSSLYTCCNFWYCTLFRLFRRFNFSVH